MKLHPLLVVSVSLLLSGCESWMGDKEGPPLPGERISVLAYDQQIKVDPNAAATPLALPPPRADANWPTSGGAADHAGGNHVLGADLKKAWSADVGDGAGRDTPLIPGPVVADGAIYAMDSETRVSAFAADTGRKRWSMDAAPTEKHGVATGGGLAFDNGRLFVSTGFGEVLALNPADGSVVWRSELKTPLRSAPTASQGLVFVVSIDNQLIALSAADGKVQWTHAGLVETAGLLGAPSPAVSGDTLLVAYSSGELYALRVLNGREQWSDNLASTRREGGVLSIAAIRGQPVLASNGVAAVAVSNSGRLVAIDTRSGQRVWDQRISGTQMPWVVGGTVFLVSSQAQLMALNLADGKVRWVMQLPQWKNEKSHDGLIAWYGPVLAGGRLWLTSSTGRLRGFDPADGKQLADLRLGESTDRPPVVANGVLYTLDNDATLTAWR